MPVHQCISHNMKDLSVSNMYLASRHISGNGKVSLLTNCWGKVNEPKYNQIGEAGERSKTQPSTKQSSSGRVTRMGLLRWLALRPGWNKQISSTLSGHDLYWNVHQMFLKSPTFFGPPTFFARHSDLLVWKSLQIRGGGASTPNFKIPTP